jgi:hypothetical protein
MLKATTSLMLTDLRLVTREEELRVIRDSIIWKKRYSQNRAVKAAIKARISERVTQLPKSNC